MSIKPPFSFPASRLTIILAYYALSALAIIGVNHFGLTQPLINEKNFHNWDARNYLLIKEQGYTKEKARLFKRVQAKFRVAFFPLFPMIWRMLNVSAITIAILNGFVFIGSFLVLARFLPIQQPEILLCLSVPNAIFFFLPYTESTFFFTSTLLLLGLHRDNKYLTCAGILLSSLARPAFTVFIPAIILLELFTNRNVKSAMTNILLYLFFFGVAFVVVGLVQYKDTGEWFKFLTAQQHWGAALRWPDFPLRTFQGGIILLLDGAALLCGIIAAGILITALWRRKISTLAKPLLFSLLYVAGISFAVIIFRGGDLFSLNRFVFATPFFLILFYTFLSHPVRFKLVQVAMITALLLVFWMFFDAYSSLDAFSLFLALSGYLLLFLLMKAEQGNERTVAFAIILAVNFVLQIYFYFRFLSGGWVA